MNELWNEVKFNDRDPHWYTRRVKEAIHIRLHPNKINRDNGIDIPEAWILTVNGNITGDQYSSGPPERTTFWIGRAVQRTALGIPSRNKEDRNAPLLTIMIQMVRGNQSTSSRDED